MQLVLSLFPGVDLLGRAFSGAGFCVVKGPDIVVGEDVREFVGIRNRINGIAGGPPCQGFSAANKHRTNPDHPSVINSREMLLHYCRIVHECQPEWFLCENVPSVPDIRIEGYSVQRLAISDFECGGVQLRSRHIQFGHRLGYIIRPRRVNDGTRNRKKGRPAKSVTTKTSRYVDFPDHCRRQGLEKPLSLPGWCKQAKFKAVGNGVPIPMGKALAEAVKCAGPPVPTDCPCGCGRALTGKQKSATVTCRKRLQDQRDRSRAYVTRKGFHPESRKR